MSPKLPPGARIIQPEAPPTVAEKLSEPEVPIRPLLDYHSAFGEPSSANLALLFAILGWVVCGVFGVAALAIAREELNAIEAGRRAPNNLGTAKAAFWIAVVQLGFYGLFVVFLGLGFLAAILT